MRALWEELFNQQSKESFGNQVKSIGRVGPVNHTEDLGCPGDYFKSLYLHVFSYRVDHSEAITHM